MIRPRLGPPRDPARTYQSKRFQDISAPEGGIPNRAASSASLLPPNYLWALRLAEDCVILSFKHSSGLGVN